MVPEPVTKYYCIPCNTDFKFSVNKHNILFCDKCHFYYEVNNIQKSYYINLVGDRVKDFEDKLDELLS